jgi:hypothetical protein
VEEFDIETSASYKWIDLILSFLLMMVLLLSFRQFPYINFIAIPIILSYAYWLFKQVRLLNAYFKSDLS